MLRKIRKRWTDAPRKNRVLATLAAVLFTAGCAGSKMVPNGFLHEHGIYFERHTVGCLPWLFYYADRHIDHVERGDIFLFASHGADPLYKDGSPLVKMAVGVPGDQIRAVDNKLYVNGRYWGSLTLGLMHFHKPSGYWDRQLVLQQDEYFMLGTEPRSFDSRFWGVVKRDQFRTKLHPFM